MGASSSGQVITPKKGKSLFEIQSRSVFQIEISYEFTETKMYMQFQEQYDGTGGDERFSTWNMESNKNQEKYVHIEKCKSLCDQQRQCQ